jgi:hypothetical protein
VKTVTEEKTTEEAWHEVGRQFQVLGESLAEAFRTAWENEKNRRRVEEMQSGVEAMIDRVEAAIEDFSASPEAQKVKETAEKAAESARVAGEKTWQETRPMLLSALNQLNAELQKMIGRLEKEPPQEVDAEPLQGE